MNFPLAHITFDQQKWLMWFIRGALYEHNQQMGGGMFSSLFEFENYFNDTVNKVSRYLTGKQSADASFSDFQCGVALEARKLFNPTPIGYVTAGDIEYTTDDHPINMGNGIENAKQAKYWMEECKLRVRPIFAGEPLNK